jgi:cytochrome b561
MNVTAPASASPRYTGVAIGLHWLLAVMIVGAFGVGLYMVDLPFSPQRLKLYNWHKWAGVLILALSAARLLWRLTHRPPADLPMPAWQARAAHAAHAVLYVLFFAVPLLGWAYSSAAGFPIVLFGVLPLPDFVPVSRELADALKPWHGWLAKGLAVVVLLHVAGALKHQFIDRDGLLRRMWPAPSRPPVSER